MIDLQGLFAYDVDLLPSVFVFFLYIYVPTVGPDIQYLCRPFLDKPSLFCVLAERSLLFFLSPKLRALAIYTVPLKSCTLSPFELVWFLNRGVGVGGTQLYVLKGERLV